MSVKHWFNLWFQAVRTLILACLLTALPAMATAHSYNESYIYFDVTEDTLSGRIEVTLTDLARIKFGDGAVDIPLERATVEQDLEFFLDYFETRMTLVSQGEKFDVSFGRVEYLETAQGVFAQLLFDVEMPGETPVSLEMSYDGLFSDVDPAHRGFALIGSNTRNGMDENESYISLIFAPGDGMKTLYLNDEKTSAVALTFLEHGVWHIWLGFDHVLFLITLLISAVMILRAGRWEPSVGLRQSMFHTIKIVTVFTIAHTITLSLATFGIITLPVVFVEAVIALSIAVVALGNLIPRFHAQSWKVVFIFGLFHGFGFANVLEPLGLDPTRKAIGLAAFNIGVELGQLAIVFVLFPLLFALRSLPAYRVVAMQAGSVALIAIALFWFFERTYDAFTPINVAALGG